MTLKKVTGTPEGHQGLLGAVVLAVILAAAAYRGAGHLLHAVPRELAAMLNDVLAAVLAAAAAAIALLAARRVAWHRGLHHEPPGPDIPADRKIDRKIHVPSRLGQPAYSYTLRPAAGEDEMSGRRNG